MWKYAPYFTVKEMTCKCGCGMLPDEDFMDWLESMGLERGDVFIDNDNMGRVLNKLKSLKK